MRHVVEAQLLVKSLEFAHPKAEDCDYPGWLPEGD